MNPHQPTVEIEYPESDGRPMGETDLHRNWMVRLIELMTYRYRAQRVYVSGDLLVYYEEGNPRRFVVPDCFVAKDCVPGARRVFKIWEEGRIPNTVFEVTSLATRREDAVFKPQTFARIGIAEYFLFDPTAEYLSPPLQGFRLVQSEYVAIEPDDSGRLVSTELDLCLWLEDRELRLADRQTGEMLLTEAEAEASARQAAESAQRSAEIARRSAELAQRREESARQVAENQLDQERAAREAAEAEITRLRKLLDERRSDS